MRRHFIKIISVLAVLSVIAESVYSKKTGIAGKTGSPSETTCVSCHSGNTENDASGSITISSDIPAWQYTPGETYTIEVTVAKTGVSLFGFCTEILSSSNANAGTMTVTNSTTMQILTAANTRKSMTHKENGGASTNSKTFSFEWTAPSTDIGNITIYAAGNATNSSGTNSGDFIFNTSQVMTPAPTLTLGSISETSYCEGETGISIPYTITATFNAGNIFSAELSDASGSFASPTVIGTLNSTTSGTIVSSVGLPAVQGSAYRIRVTSSDPALTSSDNGNNITISTNPSTSDAGLDDEICGNTYTLDAQTPISGAGAWAFVSGSGSIGNTASPASTLAGLSYGTSVLSWTVSNGACISSVDMVSITAYEIPSSPLAGSDEVICTNSTFLNGNSISIGNAEWKLVSGSGNILSPNSPTSEVTNLGLGINSFMWEVINGVCDTLRDTVNIEYLGPISDAYAGADITICTTDTALDGSYVEFGTGVWTVIAGTGIVALDSDSASDVSNLSLGENTFVWTISNGACEPSRDTVSIFVDAVPTTPLAGDDIVSCNGNAVLAGNEPMVGEGIWTVLNGAGTFSDEQNANASVSGLNAGVNAFIWTISNGVCDALNDTVEVDFSGTITNAYAGEDITVCSADTALDGNYVFFGNGLWSILSGSATITDDTDSISEITSLAYGENIFVWTISNGVCEPTSDTVSIIRLNEPSIASVGMDSTICVTSLPLYADAPTVGIGTWTMFSGTGNFSDDNNPTATVSGLSDGVNVLRWTITYQICESNFADLTLNKTGDITIADAGNDQTVCISSSASLSGNTAVEGTGLWTLLSGSGDINNNANPTSSLSNLAVGENIFTWTITKAGCGSTSDMVSIFVDALPTVANAGSDEEICADSLFLDGNSATSGTGIWSVQSGNADFLNSGSSATKASNLSVGENILVWTISSGVCPPSSDEVIITVAEAPTTANAGSTQNICDNNVTLNANTPLVGSGEWSLVSGSGNIINPTFPTTLVDGLAEGTSIFRWTIKNGFCDSSYAEVSINNCVGTVISTDPIFGSPFCENTSYSVEVFFVSSITLSATYRAELSDSLGDFSSPITIGMASSSPISADIPPGTESGDGYRIRVVDATNGFIGSDNGSDLSINTCLEIITDSIVGSPFCEETSYNVSIPFHYIGEFEGSFKAQLSSASGSFDSPLTIGIGSASPISASIPSGVGLGTGYRIRVIHDDSEIEGTANNSNLEINNCFLLGADEDFSKKWILFPNPAKDVLHISHTSNSSSTVSISMYDLIGKEVYSEKINFEENSSSKNIALDRSLIQQGVYLLKVQSEEGEAHFKLLLE